MNAVPSEPVVVMIGMSQLQPVRHSILSLQWHSIHHLNGEILRVTTAINDRTYSATNVCGDVPDAVEKISTTGYELPCESAVKV